MSTAEHPLPTPAHHAALTVRRIGPGDAEDATRSVRAFLDRLASAGTSLDLLYGGYDRPRRLIAAAALIPQAGRTGLVFVSPPSRRDTHTLARVLEFGCEQAPRDQLVLAQAMLNPNERRELVALQAAGFRRLTTLAYMSTSIPRAATEPPLPVGVEVQPYDTATAPQFIATLESTYHASRDCPALRGLRETRDVLAGHRAVGVFDPQLWWLVRVAGEPAGVLLLNRVPTAVCVELVYLGIAPHYRGLGLGAALLRYAIARCSTRGEVCLTLAVDTENAPAMSLYRRNGFARTATREVMIRPLV